MLLKSRAWPDMLPFSLCNKKRLAIRLMTRTLFPTTLSITSIGKLVGIRTYQRSLVVVAFLILYKKKTLIIACFFFFFFFFFLFLLLLLIAYIRAGDYLHIGSTVRTPCVKELHVNTNSCSVMFLAFHCRNETQFPLLIVLPYQICQNVYIHIRLNVT